MTQIGNIQPGGNATDSLYADPAQATKPQTGDDANSAASGSVDVTSAAPPAASRTAASPPGTDYSPAYTVEISAEGSQLSSQAAAAAGAAPSGAAAGTAATTESESDTANLSVYSDYQLQQMLSDGEITPSEYNAEIARRAAKQQAEAAQDAGRENALLADVK